MLHSHVINHWKEEIRRCVDRLIFSCNALRVITCSAASATMGTYRVGPLLVAYYHFISSNTRQTKIALRCNNESELEQLESTARTLNVCAQSIYDAYVLNYHTLKEVP